MAAKKRGAGTFSFQPFEGLKEIIKTRGIDLTPKPPAETNRNKTRFISGVSHEIRAPLSSIRSFSEILLNYDDIDAATRKDFLTIINEESARLAQLTDDMLDILIRGLNCIGLGFGQYGNGMRGLFDNLKKISIGS
ncbi:MAG: hypothetical protein M0Z60_06645 [Nitrospiraceae bacterium]|nr:hypothetical protein [Nitrospiraceae bacterium]